MRPRIATRIGRLRPDRLVVALLILAGILLAGRAWLRDHPQHDPWAPLDLNHPMGWATEAKLAGLRGEPATCGEVLERSGVTFERLDPQGEGTCRRADRVRLPGLPITPPPVATCPVHAALYMWVTHTLRPAAREVLGSELAGIEHFGTFSCRRIYGGARGRWSEHASGNAIDIAAFRLADGRRIEVLRDWKSEGAEARFLRRARDGACGLFGTVLSPDYNEAHRDHFHLDQQARGIGSVCR